MKLIGDEKLLFADEISKTNMFEWTQKRTFVLTDKNIYNIHKKSIKRTIGIHEIGGLTKTIPPSKSLEFTVHVPAKYDYRFISNRRDQILDMIKRVFIIHHKKNCPVFCVTSKNLKDFTTTEKDMNKQVSRFPLAEYRNMQEDLLDALSTGV
jgi:hypothetical protein